MLDPQEIQGRFDRLTPRQAKICQMMVQGYLNKQIADRLGMSINTVKTHRMEIFRRMETSSLLELARQIDALQRVVTQPQVAGAMEVATTKTSQAAGRDEDTWSQRSLRILVIEDNPDLLYAITEALSRLGHFVRGLPNADGLDAELSTHQMDLVVLDIGLGEAHEDGFSIALRLRKTTRCGIVMATARADLDSRIQGLEQGADAYLVKPINFAELNAVMLSVMRRLHHAPKA